MTANPPNILILAMNIAKPDKASDKVSPVEICVTAQKMSLKHITEPKRQERMGNVRV